MQTKYYMVGYGQERQAGKSRNYFLGKFLDAVCILGTLVCPESGRIGFFRTCLWASKGDSVPPSIHEELRVCVEEPMEIDQDALVVKYLLCSPCSCAGDLLGLVVILQRLGFVTKKI